MNPTLRKLKDVIAENCITLILNTHRTGPDNQKDPIVLKNLVREAEERLLTSEDKRVAQALIQRLKELADGIDHNHNLESLILFVNEEIADFVRLPIAVEDRVIIDYTFATRDLVRALHLQANYFVLVLSQQTVRLIEAFNDSLVQEVGQPFPIENTRHYTTNQAELSNAPRLSSLMAEFFNQVDKELNQVRKEHPLPVLICTEESNYHEYLKVADEKRSILAPYLNGNRLDQTAQAIVSAAWEVVKPQVEQTNRAQKEALREAVNSGTFLSDLNDIWNAMLEGRIQTLFIEEGLFHPARISGREVQLVSEEELSDKEVVDDVYDEFIETNMNYGGDVVFLPRGELSEFQGFGAITRY